MSDYKTMIDAETWAFIDRTERFYPPDYDQLSLAEQRAIYERMCRDFAIPYPAGVSAETKQIAAPGGRMQVRRYRAMHYDAHALVLYFHGGGYVMGSLESHDDVCADICHRTGLEVVAVDYRLAPEHPFPAAFDDAMAAFDWARKSYDLPILLAGDSAGGHLAAIVASQARGQKQAPIGQVLIYPSLGGKPDQGSYLRHADAPMLTTSGMQHYRAVLANGQDLSADPRFAPLADSDFSGLPPTIVIAAQCDPLSSDGEAYCGKIRLTGGRGWFHEETGLVHGYLRARHSVARARESFSRIVESIKALSHNQWHHP